MTAGHDREQLLADLYEGASGPQWAHEQLLRPGEVATLFQVSRRAVNEWARTGKLPFVTTLGGQKRFPAERVRVLLTQMDSHRQRRASGNADGDRKARS